MTSEQIAKLRALHAAAPLPINVCLFDADVERYANAAIAATQRLLDEREVLLGAAREAAEGFDVVAADDVRLLALLRAAIAKAESP